MNNFNTPLKSFNKYILRKPILPLDFFINLTSDLDVSENELKRLFNDEPVIKEIIYLSSPSLYYQIQKWTHNKELERKKVERIKISFLKYLSRASFRCTPFGLFAGCTIGDISQDYDVKISRRNQFKRKTVLDSRLTSMLCHKLGNTKELRESLVYYPNTSIYKIGEEIRYVKYVYVNNHRQQVIMSVENSYFLNQILKKVDNGLTIDKIISIIRSNEITYDMSAEFINEIIDEQILVSELDKELTSEEDELTKLINITDNKKNVANINEALREIKKIILRLDSKIGNPIEDYLQIINLLEIILDKDVPDKNVFQVDLYISTEKNEIPAEIMESVKEGLIILNLIEPFKKNQKLEEFKINFSDRYGRDSISLTEALDPDVGIGYGHSTNPGEINSLIDQINFLPEDKDESISEDISLTPFQQILNKKIVEAYKANDKSIEITDEDFTGLKQNWDLLPATLYSTFSVLRYNEGYKIVLKGGGGSSGANLISRFANGNKGIMSFAKEIVAMEESMHTDLILAEIVHMPTSHLMGNILVRPTLRKWEIPILAKSSTQKECQIKISDLEIKVTETGKIKLTSKRLNAEIAPRLTSAHNYWSNNSLPIYHFLGDLQLQGKKSGIYLSLGELSKLYKYTPRIEYKNIILIEGTWNLKREDVVKLIETPDRTLLDEIKKFRIMHGLPPLVKFVEFDKSFLINFDNILSIKTFIDSIKKVDDIVLQEHLKFKSPLFDKIEKEQYCNEMIMFFHK